MKKIVITLCIFMTSFSYANAEIVMLRPPSLIEVMEQNEKFAREQAEKIPPVEVPKNIELTYYSVYSGSSISIKKSYEVPLWIQEVSLDKGARVESIQEAISYNEKTGEPQFIKRSISETLRTLPIAPTSLINGQFFNPRTNPSELSFGLKSDGIVRTAGADNRNERKNILHVTGGIAEVLPYSWKNLEKTNGNFAMVNLTTEQNHYKNELIGRTYMCLKNPDKFNRSSTILVFIAQAMNKTLIEKEILRHGCTRKSTSQLDSSGSTRLYFQGNFIF